MNKTQPRQLKKVTSRVWKAYLPIGSSLTGDTVPAADLTWLLSRGIEGEALSHTTKTTAQATFGMQPLVFVMAL
jgi:hypothetical protein